MTPHATREVAAPCAGAYHGSADYTAARSPPLIVPVLVWPATLGRPDVTCMSSAYSTVKSERLRRCYTMAPVVTVPVDGGIAYTVAMTPSRARHRTVAGLAPRPRFGLHHAQQRVPAVRRCSRIATTTSPRSSPARRGCPSRSPATTPTPPTASSPRSRSRAGALVATASGSATATVRRVPTRRFSVEPRPALRWRAT